MKNAVRENFDVSVSSYEEYERHTSRFSDLALLLYSEMNDVGYQEVDSLLDVGAGTGVSTSVFKEETETQTFALDISREMLHQNISSRSVQADMSRLPFHDDTFGGVAFTASLFLVPDPDTAVEEASRVLRDGGIVGAVAPLGWVDTDGDDVFSSSEIQPRSPAGEGEVHTALNKRFSVKTGTWGFETTAEDLCLFYSIPAIAARLYPRLPPEDRVSKTEDLLRSLELEGCFEERWKWFVGVHD